MNDSMKREKEKGQNRNYEDEKYEGKEDREKEETDGEIKQWKKDKEKAGITMMKKVIAEN